MAIDAKVLSEPLVQKHFSELFELEGLKADDVYGQIEVLARQTGYAFETAETPEKQLAALKLAYLCDQRLDSPFITR